MVAAVVVVVLAVLVNNNIIDSSLDWIFEKGHLVIVGDIFDRGDKVNEILWLVYKLEIQAKNSGGQIHYLLGNHEYMILYNDLRYVNNKYMSSAKLMNLDHYELYDEQTVIGRWLRSKPTIIKINNILFYFTIFILYHILFYSARSYYILLHSDSD